MTEVEEIDDEIGFYREDFSAESDWEVFNAQLSELFQEWELSSSEWGRALEKQEIFRCNWNVKEHNLELFGTRVGVTYLAAQMDTLSATSPEEMEDDKRPIHVDLMSLKNTFPVSLDARIPEKIHPIARFYGLRRFVVIKPHVTPAQFLTDSKVSVFLSSAAVVAADVKASVPIFVQLYDEWNYFVGVGMSPMLRTNFDLVALERAPAECRYLSGLLWMFKEKVPATYLRPATVSVRISYLLGRLQIRVPMHVPFAEMMSVDSEDKTTVDLSTDTFTVLPTGYFPSSYTEVYLMYTWPEVAENIVIDSSMRTDFIPANAPMITMFQMAKATSYLSNCLRDYQKLYIASEPLESFVGRIFASNACSADVNISGSGSTPLSAATQPPPKKVPGPMNENEANQMIYFLFPDIYPYAALFPYTKTRSPEYGPHTIRSAAPDSLVSRLSCLLATCNAHFGGKSGLAQLWATFTRELRYLWDCGITIPGVAPGFSDSRTCLLHQKLQMLNVCIELRSRAGGGATSDPDAEPTAADSRGANVGGSSGDDDEEDDEEFYDCDEQNASGSDASSVTSQAPEGRAMIFGDMKLLGTDDPLYVPFLQELVPKTEDQIFDATEETSSMRSQTGVTSQLMLMLLRSDMEAFKAANPSAQLADFVRWYSPKDWEETTDETDAAFNQLSVRMVTPGNKWATMWEQARAVPFWRQKRLFDHMQEAQKVLNFLETRDIGDIYELTIVPMLHSALLKLQDIFSTQNVMDVFGESLKELTAELLRLSREPISDATLRVESIIAKIETLEEKFYQYLCYSRRLVRPYCVHSDELKQKFRELMDCSGTAQLIDAKTGNNFVDTLDVDVAAMLRERLVSKEYVIRVDGEVASTTKGDMGPQFLRAVITGEAMRLCGAFTENTTFV